MSFRQRRTVIAFVAVIALFFGIEIVLVTGQQRDAIMALARDHAAEDLELMAEASLEAILKHDYVTIRSFVERWGASHGEYQAIRARTPSGFLLAEYVRAGTPGGPGLLKQQSVTNGGRELMVLEVERDFSDAQLIVNKLQQRLALGSVLGSLLLAATLWYSLRRTAIRPMELEIALRKKVEEELELNVRERTAALENELQERRRIELQLLEREERIRLLLTSMAEAMYGVDRRGFCTFCNPACVKFLGYGSEKDLVGRNLHRMIHHTRPDGTPFPEEECTIHAGNLNQRGVHVDSEVFWRADGTSFPVEYWSSPIVNAGEQVGSVVTFLDITERRKLETQLMHSQKMEAVGRLAGGVAHDFNNILTAIIGYGDMLRMKLGGNPLVANVDNLMAAAQRAAHLTKDLLAFSRKQSLSAKMVDLNEIVPKIAKLIARLIGEDIEFEVAMTGGELPVLADSGQIEQVLMNLATNARDAMPKGGSLKLRTQRIVIDESHASAWGYGTPGEYALLTVSDSGVGMDARTREQIFEPFFTTKEVGKGTGLGLATAYGIVKQHNGFINVYSEVGKGTIFRIYLPIVQAAVAAEAPAAEQGPIPRGSETVLLAEDDASLRTFAKHLLEEHGYRVLEARDGEEALRVFQGHRDEVDVLLLDIVMPRMNGRRVFEEISRVKPGVRVLFSSGYTADIITVRDIIDEGLHFIQKPMAPRELLQKLRKVLDG